MGKRKPLSDGSNIVEPGPSQKRARSKDEENDSNDNISQRRAGTISYMILKNFMCHSFLEVNFDNNVSFIIGKNGSGKSAILTALIVGFGGKASLTNRGTSIKGFVKAGKNSGSVEIQINNEGALSYRPNVFGKKITIMRTFTASGSSQYKIKSETGEVISTLGREIHNITSYLNIQVDNPICILNQDTSRNFLSSNNPKHKFTLFMKATKLDTLYEEYKRTEANRKDSVSIMSDKETNIRKLSDEIARLKRKIDGHKSIMNLRDRRKLCHLEMFWAKVRDCEEELHAIQKRAEGFQKKCDDIHSNKDKKEQQIKQYRENVKELERKVEELRAEIEVQTRPQRDLKRTIEQMQEKYTTKKRARQQLHITIQSKTKDAEYLETEISNANENMNRVEQEKVARLRNLEKFQEKIKQMEDHLQTSRNDLFQLKNDLSHKEENENQLRSEIRALEHRITNESASLQAATRESGNKLLVYGRDMPKVIQMIQQYKNRFTHEPRGPLGAYIKVKDKKWIVAVEGYVGPQLLSSFTVDNNKDNQLLREIFSNVWTDGKQPPVITSKFIFKKHDVSKNMADAPPDCLCLYNALDIEDVIVSNCVVDQSSVETIVLIPTDARAQELLSQRQNVPRNCAQGVTMKGDKYYPDPNYKTYGSRYHRANYLQVDTKDYILKLQQNITTYTKEKEAVMAQLTTFRKDYSGQVSKRDELEEKIRRLNNTKQQIRNQLEDLKASAEPEVTSVTTLETELEEVKTILNEKNAEFSQITEELKELKGKIADEEDNLSKLKQLSRNLENRVGPLLDEIKENKSKAQQVNVGDEIEKSRLTDYKRKLDIVKTDIGHKENEISKLTREASDLGERIANLRAVVDINNEILEVERSILRIESDAENIENVSERYAELKTKYEIANNLITILKRDINELIQAVESRNRYYKITESYFITYIKHSFKKVLEFRQFKGTIEINMKDKSLELVVIPQQGSQGKTTTSNLSGGERSFSTVAFLYSLWQCMQFPFYFLDEFDVYMDKLNRTKVVDILLHHAKSRPTLQFVFLTPQDISFVDQSIPILRLQDPERFH